MWRAVLDGLDQAAVGICLKGATTAIFEMGGHSVSIMISRHDREFAIVLQSHGFRETGASHPLWFLDEQPDEDTPVGAGGLNYLVTDLAYRF
jgi:hypothetical protein